MDFDSTLDLGSMENAGEEKWKLSKLKEDKNEWNSVICNNADGPRDYYAEWN